MEIGVFIYQLRSFTERKNVQIGGETVKLLLEAVSNIDELVGNATEIHLPNEASVDFLKTLDRRHYELRRNIMCRICIVSIKSTLRFFVWQKHNAFLNIFFRNRSKCQYPKKIFKLICVRALICHV